MFASFAFVAANAPPATNASEITAAKSAILLFIIFFLKFSGNQLRAGPKVRMRFGKHGGYSSTHTLMQSDVAPTLAKNVTEHQVPAKSKP
jgi:hypothetical protein